MRIREYQTQNGMQQALEMETQIDIFCEASIDATAEMGSIRRVLPDVEKYDTYL